MFYIYIYSFVTRSACSLKNIGKTAQRDAANIEYTLILSANLRVNLVGGVCSSVLLIRLTAAMLL